VGFSDMSAREVAQNTGLSEKEAELAKQRDFDEPFFFTGDEKQQRQFMEAAAFRKLTVTRGGRFWHMFSGSDKGRAVQKLLALYREALRGATRVRAVGLGDSANDLPMLQAARIGVLVAKPGGRYDEEVLEQLPRVVRAPAPGPAGWNAAVLEILRG